MVTTEEMRLRSKPTLLSNTATPSSPQVLLAATPTQVQDNRTNRDRDARARDNRTPTKSEECRTLGLLLSGRGVDCRFIHDSTRNNRTTASQFDTSPANLLSQYGLNLPTGQTRPNSSPPGFGFTTPQQSTRKRVTMERRQTSDLTVGHQHVASKPVPNEVSAANESVATNTRKWKKSQPLAASEFKEDSPSRSIRRRAIPASSRKRPVNVIRSHQNVNN
ncbi:hypothetical protein Tco_0577460 [Tanacetum coccineum]